MEEIKTTDFASDVARKCNTNFGQGYQSVSEDNFADGFVRTLNANFYGVEGAQPLSKDSLANTFVGDLNYDFGLLEQGGGDIPVPYGTFSLLHISDTHGSQYAVNSASGLISADNTISFLVHSGDIFHDTISSSSSLRAALSNENLNGKLLCVPGNHDIGRTFGGSPSAFRHGATIDNVFYNGMDSYMANTGVVWGSQDGCYWYKDIDNIDSIGGKLRIIGICDFQGNYTGQSNSISPNLTQEQCEWFATLLKGLGSGDYLIVVSHYPPFRNYSISYDYWTSYPQDNTLFLSDRKQSSSITTNAWLKGTGSFIQCIIDAYQNKKANQVRKSRTANYSNSLTLGTDASSSGASVGIDFSQSAFDFSQCSPCTFLFFMNGHIHADIAHYLLDFPSMLNLNIECSKNNDTQKWASDFNKDTQNQTVNSENLTNGAWVAINKISLNFAAREINVTRIGASKTESNGLLGQSRTRDTITFPFVR